MIQDVAEWTERTKAWKWETECVYGGGGRSQGGLVGCWQGVKAREVGGGQKRARGSRERVLFKLESVTIRDQICFR